MIDPVISIPEGEPHQERHLIFDIHPDHLPLAAIQALKADDKLLARYMAHWRSVIEPRRWTVPEKSANQS